LLRFLTQDAVIAIKLGGIIFHLLLSVGVFCFVKKLTQNSWLGLCGLAIANLSGLHLYIISEFLSNLGALTFIVWSGVLFVKAIQEKSKGWLIGFFVCLLLAVFSHRSALPLIVLISVTGLLTYIFVNNKLSSRNKNLLLLVVILIIALPLILAWQFIFKLPDSLTTEFLRVPRLPFNQTTLPECVVLTMISLASVLIYFLSSKFSEHKAVEITLGSVVLWSLFVTLNPFLNHQTGFIGIVGRLSSLAYLQVAVAAPLFMFFLLETSRKPAFVFGLFVVASIGLSHFSPLPMALRPDYIRKRESFVKGLSGIKDKICQDSFIVAPHGEQFVVTAVTGFPSQQSPPDVQTTQCLYWLIHQPNVKPVEFSESINVPESNSVLVTNEHLKMKLKSLSNQEVQMLFAQNPHLKNYLFRRKK
jgi:hypothetical protein